MQRGSASIYVLLGIAGALVGSKVAEALDAEIIVGAIAGATFFVIGWRQLQVP
jgi:uncharacterized membrane protein YeaQ/YmgE (transglycosylase-associated protein family)